jgi:hypothetical protein
MISADYERQWLEKKLFCVKTIDTVAIVAVWYAA